MVSIALIQKCNNPQLKKKSYGNKGEKERKLCIILLFLPFHILRNGWHSTAKDWIIIIK
jgi:hypothetical protein